MSYQDYKTPIKTLLLAVDNASAYSLSDFGFTDRDILYAEGALITVTGETVRYGLAKAYPPTASFGHIIASGGGIEIEGHNMVKYLKFISTTATPASVVITLVEKRVELL